MHGILIIIFWIFNIFYIIPFYITKFLFEKENSKNDINNPISTVINGINEALLICKDNSIDLKNYKEDTITRKIRDILRPMFSIYNFSIESQPEIGYSASIIPKEPGQGDLIINFKAKRFSIIEAIKIKSNKKDGLIKENKKKIEEHFKKLIKNYNQIGVLNLFFFLYIFNPNDISLEWNYFIRIIKNLQFQNKFCQVDDSISIQNNIDINIAKISYKIGLKTLNIYCYLIPFFNP